MQRAVGLAIRTRRGKMSRAELAKKAGVGPSTVQRAEAGTNNKIDTLLKIARALRASLVLTIEDRSSREVLRDDGAGVSSSVAAPAQGEHQREAPIMDGPVRRQIVSMLGDLSDEESTEIYNLTRERWDEHHGTTRQPKSQEGIS